MPIQVRIKYGGLEVDGREYLEKILNYSFYVPEPAPHDVVAFAKAKLTSLIKDLTQDASQYESAFHTFAEVLRECLFNNPRKIHRILNRYLLFLATYEKSLSEYNLANISRFIIMAEYFPTLFPLFLGRPLEVKVELMKMGSSNFDIKAFENKYGVPLSPMFQQVTRMSSLFDVAVQEKEGKPKLSEQAKAVFNITRLV